MNEATFPIFDHTLHATNVWLKDVNEEIGWPDRQFAYHALRAVLHALRDRLTVDHAAALGAQLPMLIRGFYYEGWHPAGTPRRDRHTEAFLAHVAEAFPNEPPSTAEKATRAVFQVMTRHVSEGEIEKIKGALPAEIRELFELPAVTL